MKKILSLLLAMALMMALSACGGNGAADSEREQVTVALWSDQLTEQYAAYLQEQFPEVDFTFYVATNSTDFYRFKMEQGDLPDILTVRRFALRDVEDWRNQLMDLSDSELANTFPQSYLRSYTYSNGTINWLPACAEIDSIIVNKTLLEANNLAVPTNYGEFVALCGTLREKGIRPFISNFDADYTCMEVLQGLSVEQLTSQEGREWRQQYESGQTDQLSEEVWLPVFERMEELIDYVGITPADMDGSIDVFTEYTAGRAAMVRGTGDEAARYSDGSRESVLMPYYGETEEDNWYLTYPAFQIAARETEDPERKKLILDVITAMLSEEGQRSIAANQNMAPYNRGVTIDLSPSMAGFQPYIDNNRLYIRLASSDMFSVSKTVVQGMIDGTYSDARSAFDAFNAMMDSSGNSSESAAHIDTGYSYAFDVRHGSQAASAVLNSVREEVGTRLLIGPAAAVAGNVSAGDYTRAELGFLTMGESPAVVLCEMTGTQLYQYVDYVLTARGKRGSVSNDSTLYVSSGFEMDVRRTDSGYALEGLTIEGQELDREAVYTVAVIGEMTLMLQDALETAGVTEYTITETAYKQIIANRLADGRQLAAPTDYITLH